ncbi:MAG: TonB-dependent receptor, partial [Desulfomonilaceae bacterium]
ENDMVYYGNQDHYQSTNGINWRTLWGDIGYSNTSVAFTSESFNDDSYETGTGLPIQDNHSLEQALTLRNVNHYRLNGTNVAEFGLEASRVMANYHIVYSSYTDALGNVVPGSIMKQDIHADKVGGFANLMSDLSPFLSSSLGFRADYFSYNKNLDLSPRASVTARLDEKTSVTASAGVYYQTLPLILLAQNGSNKKLKDLSAIHYIIGFERLLTESTKLSVDIYQKDYRNFPVDPQQPSLFLIDELYYRYGFFFNHGDLNGNGKARSRGIELIVQKKMAKDFYGMVSASYSSSQYMGSGGAWIDRVYDNRIIFCVDGGYKPNNEWEFNIRWIYAGGVPYTPFDVAASRNLDRGVLDGNRVNADRYPAYHSLNVRFDKRFNFSGSDLVFYLSAWNVYNRKNVAQYFWNEVKNEQGTIYQWGILPVFGVEYEF